MLWGGFVVTDTWKNVHRDMLVTRLLCYCNDAALLMPHIGNPRRPTGTSLQEYISVIDEWV